MAAKDKNKKHPQKQYSSKKGAPKIKSAGSTKTVWYALGALILVTLVIYFKAIWFDFLIWDDNMYINLNERIKVLNWDSISKIFSEFYFGNYHPLTTLGYAIDYKIAGDAPGLYHFVNILMHLLNTLLVFILIKKIAPKNDYVALITAAFFAVHPLHVESVAWVSERKDVLYTFFFLLSLIFYSDYLKSRQIKNLLLAGLLFLLSCFSKSAAVILPLVMLLFDYYLNRKFTWKTLAEKIPFFAISLVFGVLAMNSQKAAMPVTEEQIIPIIDRLFIVANSFITYIIKAFVPYKLSALYPYPADLGNGLSVTYYISAIVLALLLFFVWYSRRWGKDIIFGFLFFVITIILVLQIITVGNATMADRYTYVPYIGIFFIVGKLFENLSEKPNKSFKNIVLMALIAGGIIFTAVTFFRIDQWKNDETLFSDVMKKYPENPLAYNNRGCYYLKIAQSDSLNAGQKEAYFNKSFQDFNNLIKVNNNYASAYHNRGLANYFLKDYVAAIKDFDTEIKKNPEKEELYFDRGNAKKDLMDFAGAIKDFDKVIELDPKAENAYFNRGNVKKEINDFAGAIADYDKAIEIDPKLIKAYNNRSMLKCILKDYEGTIADYDKMIELNPNDTTTIKNREVIRALIQNPEK
ncbi:MAG TPA: glycosyltransferase family 39 protein [Bacteroidales bacterium]|nr:glycosyltransferase family 39 protein [Bacteroidales bacterium]